jgi:hypothetical protein
LNHSAVTGWKQAKGSVSQSGLGGERDIFCFDALRA